MMRLVGWERRLDDVIQDALRRPYVLGEHDCFRLACRVVEALTGVDRWPAFAGYQTERQALLAIAAYGGTFVAAGDKFFETDHVGVRLARRGDIVAYRDERDKYHLGVCLGDRVAVMDAAGLVFVRVTACECCWGIG